MEERPGFWRQQVTGPGTDWQKYFDVFLGMLAPIVCLVFDPGVFRQDSLNLFDDLPLLRAFAYVFIAIQIPALAVWLFVPRRTPILSAALGGCFVAGGVLSFALGAKMFPVTLVGMFLLIGFLGLTPFLTAFVFLRNATRALGLARTTLLVPVLTGLAIVGALVPLLPAYGAQRASAQAMARLIENPDSDAALSRVRWLGSWRRDDLVDAYEKEQHPRRKANLAKAYQKLAGERIEERIARRND
jgi:hypothetical protein